MKLTPLFKSRRFIVPVSILLLAVTQPLFAADDARQAEVAERGAKVMPFSLEKTQHQFTKTASGGIQKIIARNAADHEQIQLIRQHLQQLAQKFAQGDYSGPESIHGANMPGLAQLKAAKPDEMQIVYKEDLAGASITFSSRDSALLKAVHAWFDAQVHDHGHDAMMMHHQP